MYCRAISTQAYEGEGIYQIFERTNVNGNRFENCPNPKPRGTYTKFLDHTSAAPIAPHEIPYRALLRHPKGPANPETLGSMLLAGTKTSSIKIIPVCDALRENFPSIYIRNEIVNFFPVVNFRSTCQQYYIYLP